MAPSLWISFRRWRVLIVLASAILVSPVLLFLGLQVVVNVVVPPLVNPRPERMRLDYDWAWMLWPGEVILHGFELTATGPTDRWHVRAERVTGTLSLRSLRDREVRASEVRGQGVEFVYTTREDPETEPRDRGAQWTVDLVDVTLEDVHTLGYDGVLLEGEARLEGGTLAFDEAALSVQGTLVMTDLVATHLGAAVADDVRGEAQVAVVGMDRRANLGREFFDTFTGNILLDAEVGSLEFLDTFLENAPWLTVRGAGPLHAELRNVAGEMQPGSFLMVTSADTSVAVVGWEVAGACRVHLEVGEDPLLPGSRLEVAFDDFVVRTPGSIDAMVQGAGFTITAASPDVGFAKPFTTLEVTLDIPPSEIPGFTPFGALLPANIGLGVRGGSGSVRGRLYASVPANDVRGDVYVDGSGVVAQIGAVSVVSTIAVHAELVDGDISGGRYELDGTSVELTDLAIRAPDQQEASVDGWTASVRVVKGRVHVGQPIYLDAELAMKCRDTAPFLTMFAEKRALPAVARSLLTIRDIQGGGRLRLGSDFLDLDTVAFRGRSFELLMHLRRERERTRGALFARLGIVSVGVAVDGSEKHIQVLNARKWYDSGPTVDGRGSATPAGEDAGREPRAERRADRRADRQERKADRAAAREAGPPQRE